MDLNTLKFIRGASAEALSDIALALAAVDPEMFLELAARTGNSLTSKHYVVNGFNVDISSDQLREIVAIASSWTQKVATIRLVRNMFHSLGLKDAKDLVEMMRDDGTLMALREPPDARAHFLDAYGG